MSTYAQKLLDSLSQAANGLETEKLCTVLGKTPQELGDTFEELKDQHLIVGFAGLWFESTRFEQISNRFLSALERLHKKQPSRPAVTPQEVAEEAQLNWRDKVLDRVVSFLAKQGKLRVGSGGITLVAFDVRLKERQRSLLDRVINCLEEAGANVPNPKELARVVPAPIPAIQEILLLGSQVGELITVQPDIYYTKSQIRIFQDAALDLSSGGAFTVAEFRDRLNTSRRYAVALLEHFDAIGFTKRQGEARSVQLGPY